jgi:hypothetical protein
MSENVDLVRRAFVHFLATGEALEHLFADDFVWDMSTFRGTRRSALTEDRAVRRGDLHVLARFRRIHAGEGEPLEGANECDGLPIQYLFAPIPVLR